MNGHSTEVAFYCELAEQRIQFYFSGGKKEARAPRRHKPELSLLEECLYLAQGAWHSNVTLRFTLSSQVAPGTVPRALY